MAGKKSVAAWHAEPAKTPTMIAKTKVSNATGRRTGTVDRVLCFMGEPPAKREW
jgi:hypothetical protein